MWKKTVNMQQKHFRIYNTFSDIYYDHYINKTKCAFSLFKNQWERWSSGTKIYLTFAYVSVLDNS